MVTARVQTNVTSFDELSSWTKHLKGCPGWQISWRSNGRKIQYDILLSATFSIGDSDHQASLDKLETMVILQGGKLQRLP